MTPSSHANSVQTMINNPHAFVNLPAELLLQIGGSLASFHDVLEWSLTCRRFREVWLNNTTAIYKRIAPRCLDHEPLARMLLADQGGAPPDGVVSAKDVCRLLRNAKLVGYCCDYLNEWIVPGTTPLRETCLIAWGTNERPLQLTRTERRRVIQAYYLWVSLVQPSLDPATLHERIERLPLRLLYALEDLRHYNGIFFKQDFGDVDLTQQEHRRGEVDRLLMQRKTSLHNKFYPNEHLDDIRPVRDASIYIHRTEHIVFFDDYQYDLRLLLRGEDGDGHSLEDRISRENMREQIWGDESNIEE